MVDSGGNPPPYPIPLIVQQTLANGTPAKAIPLATTNAAAVKPNIDSGVTALDPVGSSYFTTNVNNGVFSAPYPYSNGLKAAWVQFLNLRHGGSGFMFGFGTGAVGQYSAINPFNGSSAGSTIATPPEALPGTGFFGTGIPEERPFHSLSYPDINYTLMRPAMLPPSPYTNPVQNRLATVTGAGGTTYYSYDPGVRNPTLFSGYPTQTYPGSSPLATVEVTLTAPWTAAVGGGPVTYTPTFPAAIPVRRLFQPPDSDNATFTPTLITFPPPYGVAPGTPATMALTVPVSNAGETGDRSLNNLSPDGVATFTPATNVPFSQTGRRRPISFRTRIPR